MGSSFKRAALEEQAANAIKKWHDGVKQKREKQQDISQSGGDNFGSNRTIGSLDLPTHHRTPDLPDITGFPGKSEIVEVDQEISKDGLDPAVFTSKNIQLQRHLTHISKI